MSVNDDSLCKLKSSGCGVPSSGRFTSFGPVRNNNYVPIPKLQILPARRCKLSFAAARLKILYAVLAGVESHVRMLIADLDECVFHVVFFELTYQIDDRLYLLVAEALELSRETQTTRVPSLPIHAKLHVQDGRPERFQECILVLVNWDCLRQIGEMVVAVATKHRRDANEPLSLAQAPYSNFGASMPITNS